MSVFGARPQWWWVAVLLILIAVVLVALYRIGRSLRAVGGPSVTDYARAEDVREVRRILGSWGESNRSEVRRMLVVRFVQAVLCSAAFAVAAVVVADRAESTVDSVRVAGVLAVVGAVLAGVAQLVGTGALLVQLGSAAAPRSGLVVVSWSAARLYAVLYWLILMYVLVGYGLVMLAPR